MMTDFACLRINYHEPTLVALFRGILSYQIFREFEFKL